LSFDERDSDDDKGNKEGKKSEKRAASSKNASAAPHAGTTTSSESASAPAPQNSAGKEAEAEAANDAAPRDAAPLEVLTVDSEEERATVATTSSAPSEAEVDATVKRLEKMLEQRGKPNVKVSHLGRVANRTPVGPEYEPKFEVYDTGSATRLEPPLAPEEDDEPLITGVTGPSRNPTRKCDVKRVDERSVVL